MRWSNSDPLWDWAADPSGLTPVFELPLLELFCRDLLLVAEGGALLPFRAVEVTGPFEPLLVCSSARLAANSLPLFPTAAGPGASCREPSTVRQRVPSSTGP